MFKRIFLVSIVVIVLFAVIFSFVYRSSYSNIEVSKEEQLTKIFSDIKVKDMVKYGSYIMETENNKKIVNRYNVETKELLESINPTKDSQTIEVFTIKTRYFAHLANKFKKLIDSIIPSFMRIILG